MAKTTITAAPDGGGYSCGLQYSGNARSRLQMKPMTHGSWARRLFICICAHRMARGQWTRNGLEKRSG